MERDIKGIDLIKPFLGVDEKATLFDFNKIVGLVKLLSLNVCQFLYKEAKLGEVGKWNEEF